MRKKTIQDTSGSLRISEGVLVRITENATLETDGVADIAYPPADIRFSLLRSPQGKKPIQVKLHDGIATIRVAISVKFGVRADEVARAVQNNIKQTVQAMTGIAVTRVDVEVADIDFSGQ